MEKVTMAEFFSPQRILIMSVGNKLLYITSVGSILPKWVSPFQLLTHYYFGYYTQCLDSVIMSCDVYDIYAYIQVSLPQSYCYIDWGEFRLTHSFTHYLTVPTSSLIRYYQYTQSYCYIDWALLSDSKRLWAPCELCVTGTLIVQEIALSYSPPHPYKSFSERI